MTITRSVSSKYLRLLRQKRGIKPVQLAKALNLTPRYYTAKIEQAGIVSIHNLRIIFELLQPNILDIFSIIRYIPKEMRWHELKRFIDTCENRNEDPNIILAEFIRIYGQNSQSTTEPEPSTPENNHDTNNNI